MKRILILLLLLAVAGGLFAQTFAGQVNAGVGMLKLADADDPTFGVIAHDNWVDGLRAQLDARYTNDDGNVGFNARIRAMTVPDSFGSNFQFRYAFGWLTGLDGLLKAQGGRIQTTDINGVDELWGDTIFDSYGVIGYVSPIDIFKLGLGVKSDVGLLEGKTWDDKAASIWAGLSLELPDVADATLQLQATKEYAQAALSFAVSALPVAIDGALIVDNLNDFGNTGVMDVYAHAGYDISNIGLNLAGSFSKSSAADDPFFAVGAWATLGFGNIVPRLDVVFATGGEYDYSGLNAMNGYYSDGSYNKNMSWLAVSPAVQLQARSNTWIEIGGLITQNLGDVVATGGNGTSFGAFVDVKMSF